MATSYARLQGTRICDSNRNTLAADDTDYSGLTKGSNFIYCVQIGYNGKDTIASTYTLYFRQVGQTTWNLLSTSSELGYTVNTVLTDGAELTSGNARCTAASGMTWQNGLEEETSHTTASLDLGSDVYSELQWGIRTLYAQEGAQYEFQVVGQAESVPLTIADGAYAKITIASDQPSVVLNTADSYEFTDTTPTLEFTGTDPGTSDIRYHIQIDTNTSFNSTNPAGGVTLDSYSESNTTHNYGISGGLTYNRLGQTFVPLVNATLTSCKFELDKLGSPTGNMYAYLHSVVNGIPNLTPLDTSAAVDISPWSGPILIEFTFSGGYALEAGKMYFICVGFDGGTASNYLAVACDVTSPTHHGTGYYGDGSAWYTPQNFEVIFYVYGDPPAGALIDVCSFPPTAGFANTENGSDTDPFTSGQKISYTVQNALNPGTYYWRVRPIDPPKGSNVYGSYASYRTFTISSGGTTYTESLQIDSLLNKSDLTEITNINALLNKSDLTEITNINALLNKSDLTEITNLDSLLQKINSEITSIDSLLNKLSLTEITNLDSYLQKINSKLLYIDAILYSVVTYTESTQIDSYLQKINSEITNINALLNKIGLIKEFDLDSLLQKEFLKYLQIDSLLNKSDLTEQSNIDSYLQKEFQETFNIDSLLNKQNITKTPNIDSLLQKEFQEIISLDSYLQKEFQETFNIDSLLQKEYQEIFSIDAVLIESLDQVTRIGDPVIVDIGLDETGSTSINVPSDCDYIVVGVTSWSSTSNQYSNGSLTLNSEEFDVIAAGDVNGSLDLSCLFGLKSPSTGTQTLAWDWVTTSYHHCYIVIAYYKNVDQINPIRDSGADQGISGADSVTTGSMTAQSGDMAVAVVETESSSVGWVGANQVAYTETYIYYAEAQPTTDIEILTGSIAWASISGAILAKSSGVINKNLQIDSLLNKSDLTEITNLDSLLQKEFLEYLQIDSLLNKDSLIESINIDSLLQKQDIKDLSLDAILIPTYFGLLVDSSGNYTGSTSVSSNSGYNLWTTTGITCPGSGNQKVVSLGVSINGNGTSYVRLGIYDSSGNLVAQGSERKITTDAESWIEWSAEELSVYPLYLVGGETYRIFLDQYNLSVSSVYGASSGTSYNSINYTAGLPSTIPSPSGTWNGFPFRIGIIPSSVLIYTESLQIDSLLNKSDLVEATNIDSYLQKEFQEIFNIDSLLQKEYIESLQTDTLLNKLNLIKEFDLDSLLQKEIKLQGITVSDDFNRENGPLITPWSVLQGGFSVSSNVLANTASSPVAIYTGNFNGDQFSQATILNASSWKGLIVRCTDLGSGNFQGYCIWVSGSSMRAGILVPGSWGTITWPDRVITSVQNNDIFRVEIIGQNDDIAISVYINEILNYTYLMSEATVKYYYNSGNPGVFSYTVGNVYDNWSGGDLFGGVSLDSYLQKEFQEIFNIDAVLYEESQIYSESLQIDSLLTKFDLTKISSIDSYLQKEFQEIISLDSYLQKEDTNYLDIDSYLQKEYIKSLQTDALLNKVDTNNLDIDSYLQKQYIKTLIIDSLLTKFNLTEISSIDSLLQHIFTEESDIDALLNKFDLIETLNTDAILQSVYQKQSLIDSYLQKTNVEISYIDALLNKLGLSEITGIDAIILSGAETYTKLIYLEALINKLGLTKESTIDAYLQELSLLDLSIDSILQKEITEDISLEALLNKFGLTVYSTLDSLIQKIMDTEIIILDSYSESYTTEYLSLDLNNSIGAGQTFLANNTGYLSSCSFYLKKEGNPTGNAYAKLYQHTGIYGSTGKPIGNPLAISQALDVSIIGTEASLINFTFTDKYEIITGNYYVIVCEYENSSSDDKVLIGCDSGTKSHSGNAVLLN